MKKIKKDLKSVTLLSQALFAFFALMFMIISLYMSEFKVFVYVLLIISFIFSIYNTIYIYNKKKMALLYLGVIAYLIWSIFNV